MHGNREKSRARQSRRHAGTQAGGHEWKRKTTVRWIGASG